MDECQIGLSGLKASVVGLGGNNFGGLLDRAATASVVHRALDLGVTFFDTADTYGKRGGGDVGQSEIFLGLALGAHRKDAVLATKFGNPMDPERRLSGASRRYIVRSVEASLLRLKTDWIDLYQLHSPDSITPIEETLRALDDLIHAGKVLYVGCSNFSAWQFVDAQWAAKTSGSVRFISCQSEYSLVNRSIELDLLPAAKAHGASIIPYYPLASGLLTGKYKPFQPPPVGSRFERPERFERRFMTEVVTQSVERLRQFAEMRGHTLLELAISWLVSQASMGPIIAGATSPEQVTANVAAATWRLSPRDLAEVDAILQSDTAK